MKLSVQKIYSSYQKKRIVARIKKSLGNRLIINKNTAVTLDKTAKIDVINECLTINKKWDENDPFPSLFTMGANSTLTVYGNFSIYSGSRISINKDASLSLGSGYMNSGANLACFKKIKIGHNVVISENVTIRDSDNHYIWPMKDEATQPIEIGNNVWIGINATILKGVTIGDGAVVAANSLVNKDIPPKCLVAGMPAKVIKQNIEWQL